MDLGSTQIIRGSRENKKFRIGHPGATARSPLTIRLFKHTVQAASEPTQHADTRAHLPTSLSLTIERHPGRHHGVGRSELLADAHLLLDDVPAFEDERVEDAEDGEGAADDGAEVDEEL